MRKVRGWLALAPLCMVLAGCASPSSQAWQQRFGLPRVFGNRSIEHDRELAETFDPYLSPEMGPRDTSPRPPDYRDPPAPPTKARWIPFGWGG
jgi:hypothetical protein